MENLCSIFTNIAENPHSYHVQTRRLTAHASLKPFLLQHRTQYEEKWLPWQHYLRILEQSFPKLSVGESTTSLDIRLLELISLCSFTNSVSIACNSEVCFENNIKMFSFKSGYNTEIKTLLKCWYICNIRLWVFYLIQFCVRRSPIVNT